MRVMRGEETKGRRMGSGEIKGEKGRCVKGKGLVRGRAGQVRGNEGNYEGSSFLCGVSPCYKTDRHALLPSGRRGERGEKVEGRGKQKENVRKEIMGEPRMKGNMRRGEEGRENRGERESR